MTLNEKYKPLFTSKCRYFIITGGRGSSKSFSVTTFLNYLLLEEGRKILFTRLTMSSAHISIIPEFRAKGALINSEALLTSTKADVINDSNKSSILFRGIKTSSGDQTANLKSIPDLTDWVLDEGEELTNEKSFDDIDLSVRKKGIQNRVIIIMNPATKEHLFYKRFFEQMGVNEGFNGEKDDVCYIHTTYLDNKENLSKSYLESIEKMKIKNPDKYKYQIMGSWMQKAEGVIFNNWRLGDFDDDLPFAFGQDYGYASDPSTLVKVAVDRKKKIIFLDEQFCKQALSTTELITLNKRFANRNLIIADSAEPRLIEEIKRAGVNIKASEKGADSIRIGISRMLDYELIVTPNSVNLIREFNNYAWNDKKSGVPIDKFNHIIDAIRYSLEFLIGKPRKKIYAKTF